MCRSAIEILPEVTASLAKAGVGKQFEIYIDGGIRRGSDIFKAIALGATAVGIGRPALYGLAGYGQPGVERVLDILHQELVVTMRLMGAPTIADIKPEMVITKNLSDHFVPQPVNHLAQAAYHPLQTPRARL